MYRKTLTREEELLLQDFSRNVSAKSSALFYGVALIVSVMPLWLYWRIHQLDLLSYAIPFVVGTLLNTWLIAFGYKNVKFVLKHKIAQKREDAVAKEVLRSIQSIQSKDIGKKEKDERILWKKNVVSEYEATTYSIFFNNALYYTLVIVASFYLFRTFNPTLNYLLSVVGSGALVALFSTGSK